MLVALQCSDHQDYNGDDDDDYDDDDDDHVHTMRPSDIYASVT